MSFGDSTGSQREHIESTESNFKVGNIVLDNQKSMYQFPTAIVQAEVKPPMQETAEGVATVPEGKAIDMKYYEVRLEKEQRVIVVSHKKDNKFWSLTAFPAPGDRVTVKVKRDLFDGEIIEVLSVPLQDALAKYGCITKKAG